MNLIHKSNRDKERVLEGFEAMNQAILKKDWNAAQFAHLKTMEAFGDLGISLSSGLANINMRPGWAWYTPSEN